MKSTLLIVASLIALATCNFHIGEKTLEELAAARKECFASENVDLSFMDRLDNHELPPREDLKCLSLCVFKKFNTVDEEGVYHMDVLKPKFSADDFAKIEKTFKACHVEDTDPCVKAYKLHQCFNSALFKK